MHAEACENKPLPKLSFQYGDGKNTVTLRVASDIKPQEVRVWTTSSTTRDFRDSKWESHSAAVEKDAYTFDMPHPASGFAALFGEAVYASDGMPLFLSTNVKIVGSK